MIFTPLYGDRTEAPQKLSYCDARQQEYFTYKKIMDILCFFRHKGLMNLMHMVKHPCLLGSSEPLKVGGSGGLIFESGPQDMLIYSEAGTRTATDRRSGMSHQLDLLCGTEQIRKRAAADVAFL